MSPEQVVGVAGAGTMGSGIAQLVAHRGHRVILFDVVPGAAERAAQRIHERIGALVRRGVIPWSPGAVRLTASARVADLADAGLVLEAITENVNAKRALYRDVEAATGPSTILASTTSSLSPTLLAANTGRPDRFVGLHFFNPVPVMRLVEVIPGLATSPQVVEDVVAFATALGKTVVHSADAPGFIVNRVARPFYGEAMRLLEEQAADVATIDAILRDAGGFKMGPFELTDLIGQDVNAAVTRSVWEGFSYDPRFTPSLTQRTLVAAGRLGRKSGRGFYDYGPEAARPEPAGLQPPCAPPAQVTVDPGGVAFAALVERAGVPVRGSRSADVVLPSGARLIRTDGVTAGRVALQGRRIIVVDRTLDDESAGAVAIATSPACTTEQLCEATGWLQACGLDVHRVADTPGLVLARTVAMLVNVALDAVQTGVASAADVDAAMRLGTNYPIGPLAWGERWGMPTVLRIVESLLAHYGDPRYRASSRLRSVALTADVTA